MSEATRQPPRGPEVIRAALDAIPQEPGVYLMKDARGRIIYVGKAKRLKARVASYTRAERIPSYYRHKVEAMVAKVAAVEFVVTGSEKEALLLENSLIKEHRPHYNVDLKDDKTYPHFRLSLDDDFPRLSLVRRPRKDGARYYGPFNNVGAARQTMHYLQRVFPLRRCSDRTLANRSRPCLDHEMGRCPAPCAGRIGREEYRRLADELEAFFAGRGAELAEEFERRMRAAAEARDYESAALYRDRWQALAKTLEGQRVEHTHGEDLDAVAYAADESGARLAVIGVRGGRITGSAVHDLSRAAQEPGEVLGQALLMLYDQAPPPPLILLSDLPADPSLVAEVLAERAGRRVELRKPQRGEKRGILELAARNAAQPRQAGGEQAALERLAAKLELAEAPERMECVDISHLGGLLTVASVVAFTGGRPHKAAYRHYRLPGLEGSADDYAAMAQVVGRRLGGKRPPPDLLVIDGGRGQLAMAVRALEALPPERRPSLASLAKGRAPGEADRVYLPGRKNPLGLKPGDPALLLLMRLRDEAHRFAVAFHRGLRAKALTKSILEEVPGVGPRKRAALLKAFGSLKRLKSANAREMREQAGLDESTAQRVEAFLAALDTAQPPE